jgi:hypothetical protein
MAKPGYNILYKSGFAIFYSATTSKPGHVCGVEWSRVWRKSRFLELSMGQVRGSTLVPGWSAVSRLSTSSTLPSGVLYTLQYHRISNAQREHSSSETNTFIMQTCPSCGANNGDTNTKCIGCGKAMCVKIEILYETH